VKKLKSTRQIPWRSRNQDKSLVLAKGNG